MTHPGVGPLTALAFVLIIGEADRFQCGKQVASYLGLVPLEDSSGNRRRLGHITKQGSSMLRFLLVEAAQVTARSLPQWRSKYLHLMMRRGVIPLSSVVQPATTRSAGVTGSTEPDDRGTEPDDRAGSREVPGGAAADDTPRCRSAHRTGLCADHRRSQPLSVRQAGGELSRTGAA